MDVGGRGIDAEMVPKSLFRVCDASLLWSAVYILTRFWFIFGGWYGEFENWEVVLIVKRGKIVLCDVFIGIEDFDGLYSELSQARYAVKGNYHACIYSCVTWVVEIEVRSNDFYVFHCHWWTFGLLGTTWHKARCALQSVLEFI